MKYANFTKEKLISEIKKLELEISERKERPDLTFEQAAVGIAYVTGKGEFIRVNKKFARIFGYDVKTMQNMHVNEISYPGETRLDSPEVQDIWSGKSDHVKIEKRYLRKDGSDFWGSLSLSTAKSAEGKPNHFIAILQDTSDKKTALDNFLKEKNFTDLAINSLPGIFYLYSVDNDEAKLIRWNKNHETVTGYSAEELRNMQVLEFFPKKDQLAISQVLEKLIKTGNIEIESNLKIKSGETIPYYFEGHMLSDSEKNYFLGVGLDISERKKTEEVLRKSEEKYSAVVENSNDGIVIHKAGEIVFVNQMVEKELGYKTNEVIGKNIIDFISPEFHEIIIKKSMDRIAGKAVPELSQVDLVRKDATKFPVELNTSLIKYEGESALLVIIRNISERKEVEDRLRENELKLKEAQEISQIGHWNLDLINNKLEWSDEIFRIFGVKPQEIKATYEGFLNNIHPDDREMTNKAYSDSLVTKKPYEIVHRLKLKDGTIKHVIEKCESFFDENGKAIRSVGTVQDVTNQIESENALKESEMRFKSFMDNAPFYAYIKNSKLMHVFDNQHVQELNENYTGKDVTSRDYFNEKTTKLIEDADKKIQTGESDYIELEYNVILKGKNTWLKDIKFPIYIDDETTYLGGIAINITESKEAGNKLKESEEKFRKLVTEAPIGIIVTSLDGNIIEHNAMILSMSGYSSEEIMHKNVLEIYKNPNDGIRILKILKEEGIVRNFESEMKHKNGQILTANISLVPFKFSDKDTFMTIIQDISEQKKNEEELNKYKLHLEELVRERTEELELSHQENIKLSNAIEQGYFTVMITNKVGKIEYVNPNFTRTTGYAFEEVKNQNPGMLKSGKTPNSTYKELWKTIGSGKKWKGEFINKKKNGEIYWESAIISPIFNNKEEITHFVAVQEDITNRKKVEEELILFKTFTETSIEGFGMADLKGQITYMNKGLKDIYGFEKSPYNTSFLDFYTKEDARMLTETVLPEVQKMGQWQGELNLLTRKGKNIPAHHNFFFIKDENGQPYRIAAVITDITKQKQIESELKRSKEQAENALRELKVSNHEVKKAKQEAELLNKVTEIVSESETFEIALKECLDSICSSTQWPVGHVYIPSSEGEEVLIPTKIWHLDDKKAFTVFKNVTEKTRFKKGEGLPGRIWESGQPAWIYNVHKDENFTRNKLVEDLGVKGAFGFPIMIKDELVAVCEFFTTNEMDPNEHWLKTMKSVGDQIELVFERKRNAEELRLAKQAAEDANKAKSTFLANMSHEIRTPMNAILGFSEILSKRIKDPSQIDYLASIQSSGKTLLMLINDILDLSKIESGKMEFSYEPSNIKKLIQDLVGMFRIKIQEKNLQLNVIISEDVPNALNIDELRINQILINLINNSLKFTEKGYIEIEVLSQNKSDESLDLLISVEDTGIGIPKKHHEKIFQAFDQMDKQDNKKYGGTGLGLAITQQIVNQMNGRIELISEVGEGSVFTIIFKDVKISETEIKDEERIEIDYDTIQFDESTVLIVDDIKTNRDVLKGYMSDYNIHMIEAENGQDAIKALEKHKPDLVFLDLRMPVMDGYEANEIIKKNPGWANIPIVAITASAFSKDEKKIIKLGFSDYIRKPAGLTDILNVLKKYLKHTIVAKDEKDVPKITSEIIDVPKEVLLEIDQRAMPVWEEIKNIRNKKRVILLSEILIDIGETFKASPLIRYGTDLRSACESFDIEKEQKLIQKFPDFIKKIKA